MTTLESTPASPPPLLDTASSNSDASVLRWPADRFYWAVLEIPGRLRTGPVPPGLLLTLEDELPIGIENLHMVCTPIGGAGSGRVLVCAATLDALSTIEPHVLSLTPEALPVGIEVNADVVGLNLLIGEFESPMRKSARRSGSILMAATLVICSGLAALGLTRRTSHAQEIGATAVRAADTVLGQAVPDHREETLTATLAQLRQAADLVRKTAPPVDAAEGLEGVLKNWPSGANTPSKPQSLTVSADGVNIAVVVEGDPAAFLGALKAPAGFTLDEPRLTSVGELTRLSLHMRPVKGAAK